MRRIQIIILFLALGAGCAIAADGMTVKQTARLIDRADRRVQDSTGWARDLLDVLRAHGMDRSRENVCASIAIISQESSFRENPSVPGLGKLSEQELREKLGKLPVAGAIALRMLEREPTPDDSYIMRIRAATTERDLDLVYRAFVDDLSKRTNLGTLVGSGLLNKAIESKNNINTAGSMQVSVAFAVKAANRKRWLPMQLADVYAVRDELYTRRGGMYYGILQLLGYDTGYSKKIYRFADYNAGRYASRNAAFQAALSKLAGEKLALDGDLLLYDGGEARPKASATERALRAVSQRFELNLSEDEIRKDLLREKDGDFTETKTFRRVRDAYRAKFSTDAPFAMLPDIALSSPKITHRMTTADFANRVNRRYQVCMTARL